MRRDITREYREIVIRFLRKRDGDLCGICKQPVVDFPENHRALRPSVDHIQPVSEGGEASNPDNLQLAHLVCNLRRNAQTYKKYPLKARKRWPIVRLTPWHIRKRHFET